MMAASGATSVTSATSDLKSTKQPTNDNAWDEIMMDEGPELLADNLYNLTTRMEFMARRTEPGDIPQITAFIDDSTREVFASVDVGKLYEKSLFSLVLTDLVRIDEVMAHASFSDNPQDKDVNIDGKLWKTQKELRGMDSLNTLFVTFLCCNPDVDMESAVQEVLRHTFLACALVDYIVIEASSTKYRGSLYFPSITREAILTVKDKSQRKLLIFDKNLMYPKMKIREGREHDLDDLSPLMILSTNEMEENFNKSYLNDLIAMSDRNNQSVVAEHKSIAVGLLTVTTDINYQMLNNFFQLEPFHGLFKPHVKDEINLAFQVSNEELRMCKADDKKYITDDYEESLQGSDINSRISDSNYSDSVSSSSSGSDVSISITGDAPDGNPSNVASIKKIPSRLNNRGIVTRDVTTKISDVNPQAAKTIIPMLSSTDEMLREGDELSRGTRNSVDEEIRRFPKEILKMHEQMREGNLKMEDIDGLEDDVRDMFKKLTELYAKKERDIPTVMSQFSLTDITCYPMAILDDRKPVYHGIPNALAIQLCVMDKKYSIRILDLIQGAFLCFPNREYCIITVPLGKITPSWLQYFVKVVHRKQSLFDRELYVLHRSVFNSRLKVRLSADRDIQKVRKLMDSMYSKENVLTHYYRALGKQNGLHAFVATAGPPQQHHVVGLVILSDNDKVEHYQVNYNIDDFVYTDLQEPTEYAYVHHFILIPCFKRFGKKILKEVMRYLKKNVLFHCVYSPYRETAKMNEQTVLNNLDDWHLVAPRPRINYKKIGLTDVYDDDRIPPYEALDSSEPYALLLHSRKFTFELKADVTTRIIFVGASDTALACIEKLITTEKLNFVHLTLVSPHGLPGSLQPDEIRYLMLPRRGGPALSMDTPGEWVDRVGIHLKVNVIFGTVTSFLRDQKVVVVNRKDVIPYDVLVLTVGQQFRRPDFGDVEITDTHMTEFIVNSAQQDETKKEKIQTPLRRHTKKPKNVFVINSEMNAAVALNFVRSQIPFFRRQRLLIHGACLEAYCCLNALLRMGVSPERIVFVIRPDFHMDWEDRQSYRDTVKLRDTMLETLKGYGIKVLPHHNFLDWYLDLRTNTVTRVNFSGPNEKEIQSYSCFAYFAYTHRRISDEFLSALLDALITFDKGISIGTDFKTNDESIWAAGPCTAYDNKLMAGKYDHPFYSSYEVGTSLANKLIETLNPTKRKYNLTKTNTRAPSLPEIMTKQLVHYAELPGGWFYMYCRRPGLLSKCCGEACTCTLCDCGTEITTGSTDPKVDRSQRYFRLWLSSEFKVQGMECLSKKRFSAYNLCCMFGVHESLLHNMLERFERGEIQCLYNFFQEPWAGAVCHDRWPDFRAELNELYSTFLIDQESKITDFIKAYLDNVENPEALKVDANIIRRIFDSSGLKKRIEMKFLDFLKFNRSVLPMYARPDFVERMIQDRRMSPIMGSRFPPI